MRHKLFLNNQWSINTLILIYVVLFAGCATTAGMSDFREKGGEQEIYPLAINEVQTLVEDACRVAGLTIEESDPDTNVIVCAHGSSLTSIGGAGALATWSYGEKVGFYLEPVSQNSTAVRGVNKANWALTAVPKDHTFALHARLHALVIEKMEASGNFEVGPLPVVSDNNRLMDEFLRTEKDEIDRQSFYSSEQIEAVGFADHVYGLSIAWPMTGVRQVFSLTQDDDVYFFLISSEKKRLFGTSTKSSFVVRWYKPDGTMFRENELKKKTSAYHEYFFNKIDMNSLTAADAGVWNVQLLRDSSPILEEKFLLTE